MVSTNEKLKEAHGINEMETTKEIVLVPEVARAWVFLAVSNHSHYLPIHVIRTGNMENSNVMELVLEYQ